MGRYNKVSRSYRNKLEGRILVSSGIGLGKVADLVNMVMHFEWRYFDWLRSYQFLNNRFLPLNSLVAMTGYKNTNIILVLASSKWWEIAALFTCQMSVSITPQRLPQQTSKATAGEVIFFLFFDVKPSFKMDFTVSSQSKSTGSFQRRDLNFHFA